MKVPPLLKLIAEMVSVRRLLINRFTVLIVVVLVTAVAAQGYVVANNDGYVTGHVVDGDGEPIEDATVTLSPQTISSVPSSESTTTDENGEFEFRDESLLEFTVHAEHEERGESETDRYHLYFKGQNTEVELVIQ